MIFEFIAHADFNFLESFAETFGLPQHGDTLIIPEKLGKGSVRNIDLGPDFKLLFHHYTFKDDFVLRRKAPEEKNDVVTIIFYTTALSNNFLSNENRAFTCTKLYNSAIEIASNDLNSEIRFPAGTEILFTVVGIKKSALSELLTLNASYPLVETITRDKSSFLYYENMWPDIEKILEHLALINKQDPLNNLYFKIKVQELIYLLFNKLLKRENLPQQVISNEDAEKMHTVRTTILSDLSEPPALAELARMIGMSETKMTALFKQVFGDSIYNYYQKVRMGEAAFLLRESDFSVSEVGHQLGFTNLSHFSRLFKKHYDLTPKKYSSVG